MATAVLYRAGFTALAAMARARRQTRGAIFSGMPLEFGLGGRDGAVQVKKVGLA